MEMEEFALGGALLSKALDADIDCWGPKLGVNKERLTPTEDLKEVRIGPLSPSSDKDRHFAYRGRRTRASKLICRTFD